MQLTIKNSLNELKVGSKTELLKYGGQSLLSSLSSVVILQVLIFQIVFLI